MSSGDGGDTVTFTGKIRGGRWRRSNEATTWGEEEEQEVQWLEVKVTCGEVQSV